MWGIEIQLSDGSSVPGVIFDDGTMYAHEPIADSYACAADLTADQPGCKIEHIGPVIPVLQSKKYLAEEYGRVYSSLQSQLDMLDKYYKQGLESLEQFDHLPRPEVA